MKFIVLAIYFLSFNVFAQNGVGDSSGGGKISWRKILKEYNRYVPDAPKITFENRSFEPFDVCYLPESDEFRTSKEVKVSRRESRGDRDIWINDGKKYLYTDRIKSKEICGGNGNRCSWEQVIYEQPLKPVIDVRAPARGDRSFGKLLFKKEYQIPHCVTIE